MTDILFCVSASEKKTYVVKGIDMAISSLEEFGYFYAKNVIFLDDFIMQEDFEDWIETELRFTDLAQRLRQIRINKAGCIAYFAHILNELVIFDEEEKKNILEQAKEYVYKNDHQKKKLLGDQLFLREKYQSAIREYYSLTISEGFLAEENKFIGSVWHNLGCCYGMCFMFDKALECFKEAYSYNFSPKTQEAVTFVVKLKQKKEEEALKGETDSFLSYVEFTAQPGREDRYEQIMKRVDTFRKGVEE